MYLLPTLVVHFVLIYPHFSLPGVSFGNKPRLTERQKRACTQIPMCQNYFYCGTSPFHICFFLFPFCLPSSKVKQHTKPWLERCVPVFLPSILLGANNNNTSIILLISVAMLYNTYTALSSGRGLYVHIKCYYKHGLLSKESTEKSFLPL